MHPWNQPILEAFEARIARLPHALLIHGPRGVGKLALAERLAQRLLCEAPGNVKRPCDKCDPCRWFVAGNHPDYRRVEPEILWKEPPEKPPPSRVIKIEQIRELADFIYMTTHRGGLRIGVGSRAPRPVAGHRCVRQGPRRLPPRADPVPRGHSARRSRPQGVLEAVIGRRAGTGRLVRSDNGE